MPSSPHDSEPPPPDVRAEAEEGTWAPAVLVAALLVLVGGGGLALWLAYQTGPGAPPAGQYEGDAVPEPVSPDEAAPVRDAAPGAVSGGAARGIFGEPLFPGARVVAESAEGAVYTTSAPQPRVVAFYAARYEGREDARIYRGRQHRLPTLAVRVDAADSRVDAITIMAAPDGAARDTMIAVTARPRGVAP